jgi:hypothetical protein
MRPGTDADCKAAAHGASIPNEIRSDRFSRCGWGGAAGRSDSITRLPGRFPGAEIYARRAGSLRGKEMAPADSLTAAVD